MPEDSGPASKHLEIKKYPNRRYYDATRSRHLTLEEIRSLIREGHDIRVTDSKTEADITAKVLAQIILELDEEKIEAFPIALLQRLIRVNDQVIKEFVDRYFNQALTHYLQYRQQVEEHLRSASEMNPFFPGAPVWGRAMFDPFGLSVVPGTAPQPPPSAASEPKAGSKGTNLTAQVSKLQEQIANLEAKLSVKKAKNRARSPSGRRRKPHER